MRRRKKTPLLHRVVLDAAKDIRKKKLAFEREASQSLSDALGFEVTVKIKRTKASADPLATPTMKRFARKSKAEVAKQIHEAFKPF